MHTRSLIQALRSAAKDAGFSVHGSMLWKSHGELTSVIQPQRSRWSGGMYINVGIMPTVFMIKERPPSDVAFGQSFRATDLTVSPCHAVFRRLEEDDVDSMDPADMVPAMTWLFGYLERRYSNVEEVRRQELEGYAKELPRLLAECGPDGGNGLPMVDWARGTLRPPQTYYPDSKYYNPGSTGR